MSDAEVVVVGSVNADLVVSVARLPRAGETVAGGTFARFGGGKGANQAVAAARAPSAPTTSATRRCASWRRRAST